ncbi:MAG: hypothetical protein ACRC4O_07080 [Giesbergeria sp.]
MTDLLHRYWPAIWQTVSPVIVYMLATGAANLLTHLATNADWLARHPRWAGAFRLLRSTGLDPKQLAQGVRLIAGSRLPVAVQPLVSNEAPPPVEAPTAEGPLP